VVDAGAQLSFQDGVHDVSGGISGAGTVHYVSTAVVNVTGSYDVSGLTRTAGGTLNIESAASMGDLTMAGGNLGGAGDITVAGNFDWQFGTRIGGSTTVASSGVLRINGNVPILDGSTLINESADPGGGFLAGGSMNVRNDAVIDNRGFFGMSPDFNNGILNSTFAPDGSTFINSGTVAFTSTSGTHSVDMVLENSGTVAVDGEADLRFTFGGTNAGTLRSDAGSLHLAATNPNGTGEMIYATGTRFEGAGAFDLAGGTQTFSGTGIVVDAGTTVPLPDGTVSGGGSIDNQGTLALSGTTLADRKLQRIYDKQERVLQKLSERPDDYPAAERDRLRALRFVQAALTTLAAAQEVGAQFRARGVVGAECEPVTCGAPVCFSGVGRRADAARHLGRTRGGHRHAGAGGIV